MASIERLIGWFHVRNSEKSSEPAAVGRSETQELKSMANNTEAMAAMLLSTSANAYAAYASNRLLEKMPQLQQEFGDSAFRQCQEHIAQRIQELAADEKEAQEYGCEKEPTWQVDGAGLRIPDDKAFNDQSA